MEGKEYKPNKTVRYVFETTPKRSKIMSKIRGKLLSQKSSCEKHFGTQEYVTALM